MSGQGVVSQLGREPATLSPPHHGVALLGATGVVGRRIALRLRDHPLFRLDEVVASVRSVGRCYGEAAELPESLAETKLRLKSPGAPLDSPVILSALPGPIARQLEPEYARRGHLVCSNASAFRADPEVPLLVPEVNARALDTLDTQNWSGALVTNPNCVVSGLSLALAPLYAAYGIEAATVVTMQALSGAGRHGLSAWDTNANVIPHIANEAEKIPAELHKIFDAEFPVSVRVNRVPVLDGHTASVFVRLGERVAIDRIKATLRRFTAPKHVAALPSAPRRPLRVLDGVDRPQPRVDLDDASGMTVSLGGFAADPVYDVSFTLLVHNLIRGAAGACVLNAELAQSLSPTPLLSHGQLV